MLKADNICWSIKGKDILRGIDFALQAGECVGLVGPNGSGKSSLLKILALLERPSSGKVLFQGKETGDKIELALRRKIAVVFQEPLLLNTSVHENVAVGLKIRKLAKAEIEVRVDTWLDRFGVLHLKKQRARSLSGGEAQRVSLARAFALEPDVLFLDEPFSALDAPSKEALLRDLTVVFNTTKTTAVLVSHDFREIERLTQRAVLLIDGRIAKEGNSADLVHERNSWEN